MSLLLAFFLKNFAPDITANIQWILNASISQSSFPGEWKRANVTAIYKNKGLMKDPANYRPISVLPVLVRMMEKGVAKQLAVHCQLNEIIPPEQFGFRAKSSCEDALLSATSSWMEEIDKGQVVGSTLIDLSCAFDSASHPKLMNELQEIGCGNQALSWFHSYLTDRQQRVTQSGVVTDWKPVSKGVPQGSCLSPLLFNIYIRKLPSVTKNKSILFADDVTNSASGQNVETVSQRLVEGFDQIKEYCDAQELKINTGKTQFIIFLASGKKMPEDVSITLGGCSVKPTNNVKLLGVTLDRHLTFKDHIDLVVKKCHGLIGMLARAAPYLSRELLRLTYVALIRSQLEYCSAVFAPAAPSQLKKLDTIQRIAARVIAGVPRDTHSEPLLHELKLDPLDVRRKTHIISRVKAMVSGDCHPAMRDIFFQLEDGSVENSLQSRIGIGKKRFGVYARDLFNEELERE